MPLIIGSEALRQFNPAREAKDIDIVAFESQVPFLYKHFDGVGPVFSKGETVTFRGSPDKDKLWAGKTIEIHLVNANAAWHVLFEQLDIKESDDKIWYADLDVQFAIKQSHVLFQRGRAKHEADYKWIGDRVGWINKYPTFTELNFRAASRRHYGYVVPTGLLYEQAKEQKRAASV